MNDAVIVEAVRTPIARGKRVVGDLSSFHATLRWGKTELRVPAPSTPNVVPRTPPIF